MLGTCARSRGPLIEREKTKTFEGIRNTCQVAKHCLSDHSTRNVPLTVHTSLKATRHLIKEGKIPDMEETDTLDDSPSAQEEDEEMSTKIVGRAPVTQNYKKV